MKIEIISGSPRGNSITNRVAIHLKDQIRKKTEHDVDVIDVRDNEMPLLQAVFTSVESTPEPFKQVTARMLGANAFILLTPEYNGSYSAALKKFTGSFSKTTSQGFCHWNNINRNAGGNKSCFAITGISVCIVWNWVTLYAGNTTGR